MISYPLSHTAGVDLRDGPEPIPYMIIELERFKDAVVTYLTPENVMTDGIDLHRMQDFVGFIPYADK